MISSNPHICLVWLSLSNLYRIVSFDCPWLFFFSVYSNLIPPLFVLLPIFYWPLWFQLEMGIWIGQGQGRLSVEGERCETTGTWRQAREEVKHVWLRLGKEIPPRGRGRVWSRNRPRQGRRLLRHNNRDCCYPISSLLALPNPSVEILFTCLSSQPSQLWCNS